MAIRIPWDAYEVAFLLKACISVENKKMTRSEAISSVSIHLRERAIRRGIIVDEVFRNENGIGMQFAALNSCYHGKESGLTISKLFRDIVELYRNDKESFDQILKQEETAMPHWDETMFSSSDGSLEDDTILQVAFGASLTYAHTKPVSCSYRGKVIECHGWNALYLNLVKELYNDYHHVFPIGKNFTTGKRIDCGSPIGMIYSKEIADGIYLECNVSATGIVNKIYALLEHLGIDPNCLILTYRKTGETSASTTRANTSIWTPRFSEQVYAILSKYYSYGFRLGSAIEVLRFRNYAAKDEVSLPENDDELIREISAAGFSLDEKIYVFSQEKLNYIGNRIADVFSTGATAIYIDRFMEVNAEWLEEHHFVSEDIFRSFLKKAFPQYAYTHNMVMSGHKVSEHEAIINEINRISEDKAFVSIEELVEKLPYLSEEKIAWNLSASSNFIWVSEGRYFKLDHFILSDSDISRIIEQISIDCDKHGFASLISIDIDNILEQNYELTESAAYSALYSVALKDLFVLNGMIVTRNKQDTDIEGLLRIYCKDHKQCTIAEVTNRAIELTGKPNRQHVLRALYDTMIRVDSDLFVSEDIIGFDTERIDYLLFETVGLSFIPIKGLATFALFPSCGMPWTHYMLESFCYRFSKNYELSVLNFNDKNAGLIAHRSLKLNYDSLLANAVSKAGIDLTVYDVGNYLFDNGYISRRTYAHIPAIIEQASALREEN